jgi:16S rRNA (uracil1498-N3)-methyltransferase
MPANRFFLEDPLTNPHLSGEEFHHLKTVMRAKLGDTFEIVNGNGLLALAKIIQITNSSASFEIIQKTEEPPPSVQLILAQAFLRPSLLDWVIEKGTELGATQFWLFPASLSEKKEITPNQLKRLHHLTLSALKQCGRLYLPTIEIKPPLSLWEKPKETLLFGSLDPHSKPFERIASSIVIVIGPEKGFSHEEHQILEKKLGGVGVKLHTNTLRAETAALCALSLCNFYSS